MSKLTARLIVVLSLLIAVPAFLVYQPYRIHFELYRQGESMSQATAKARLESLVKHQIPELTFIINTAIANIDNKAEFRFDVLDATTVTKDIQQHLLQIQLEENNSREAK